MGRVDAAAADRLPWLPDEPSSPPAKRGSSPATLLAGGAALVLVSAVLWLGVRSAGTDVSRGPRPGDSTTATVRLPQPRPVEPQVIIAPQPEVRPVPAPEVRPAPVREVRIVPPRSVKPAPREAATSRMTAEERPQPQASLKPRAPVTSPQFVVPRPWNPRVVEGASGRLVQIGAFGSTYQAKRGWWFMVRAYPAVAHLPAVVRTTRNSKGRLFYRFQVGTTSQAHSEVLCQRMEMIRLSCAVVGLPWKAKVER